MSEATHGAWRTARIRAPHMRVHAPQSAGAHMQAIAPLAAERRDMPRP